MAAPRAQRRSKGAHTRCLDTKKRLVSGRDGRLSYFDGKKETRVLIAPDGTTVVNPTGRQANALGAGATEWVLPGRLGHAAARALVDDILAGRRRAEDVGAWTTERPEIFARPQQARRVAKLMRDITLAESFLDKLARGRWQRGFRTLTERECRAMRDHLVSVGLLDVRTKGDWHLREESLESHVRGLAEQRKEQLTKVAIRAATGREPEADKVTAVVRAVRRAGGVLLWGRGNETDQLNALELYARAAGNLTDNASDGFWRLGNALDGSSANDPDIVQLAATDPVLFNQLELHKNLGGNFATGGGAKNRTMTSAYRMAERLGITDQLRQGLDVDDLLVLNSIDVELDESLDTLTRQQLAALAAMVRRGKSPRHALDIARALNDEAAKARRVTDTADDMRTAARETRHADLETLVAYLAVKLDLPQAAARRWVKLFRDPLDVLSFANSLPNGKPRELHLWLAAGGTSQSEQYVARAVALFGKNTTAYIDRATAAGINPHDACYWLPAIDNIPDKETLADRKELGAYILRYIGSCDGAQGTRSLRQVAGAWHAGSPDMRQLSPRAFMDVIEGRERRETSTRRPTDVVTAAAQKWNLYPGEETAALGARAVVLGAGNVSMLPVGRHKAGDLSWEFLRKGDPDGLFLGEPTGCCQSINGIAESCALAGTSSAAAGFLVIRDERGNIVAQAYTWFADDGSICFDNVEAAGGYRDGSQPAKTLACVQQAAELLVARGAPRVTLGTTMSKVPVEHLTRVETPASKSTWVRQPGGELDTYSDAHRQVLLAVRPEDFTGPVATPTGEREFELAIGDKVVTVCAKELETHWNQRGARVTCDTPLDAAEARQVARWLVELDTPVITDDPQLSGHLRRLDIPTEPVVIWDTEDSYSVMSSQLASLSEGRDSYSWEDDPTEEHLAVDHPLYDLVANGDGYRQARELAVGLGADAMPRFGRDLCEVIAHTSGTAGFDLSSDGGGGLRISSTDTPVSEPVERVVRAADQLLSITSEVEAWRRARELDVYPASSYDQAGVSDITTISALQASNTPAASRAVFNVEQLEQLPQEAVESGISAGVLGLFPAHIWPVSEAVGHITTVTDGGDLVDDVTTLIYLARCGMTPDDLRHVIDNNPGQPAAVRSHLRTTGTLVALGADYATAARAAELVSSAVETGEIDTQSAALRLENIMFQAGRQPVLFDVIGKMDADGLAHIIADKGALARWATERAAARPLADAMRVERTPARVRELVANDGW